MSREAVTKHLRWAGAKTDCGALRTLGVAAARMTNGARSWAHAGILYRWKKDVRFFELKTHQELQDEPIKDEPARTKLAWVEPQIPRERAVLVVARCQLIIRCHQQNKIPYGFGYARTAFDENGMLSVGDGEVGLTCATIIDAVFASERIALLEPSKWPPPDDDDKQSRRIVIDDIRRRDRAHADRLEADIDAPRIRPEEVVAAAAVHPTVGTFDTLVDGAAVVAEQLGL